MPSTRSWLLALALLLSGCRTFDPKHPLVGAPSVQAENLGYWVWFDDGIWHVRMTAGQKPHRFQGSVAGARGGVLELRTTRADLKERIAVVGDAVQFDVDAAAMADEGFDVKIAGNCARFDLLLDGKYRAADVRLGPRASAAHRVPFEKCP
jgi:hypothetical protein